MFQRCQMWQDHVKEGCFPDCDMLPLGKLGGGFGHGEWDCRFTKEEQKTMMTLWCMFRSPLMIGAELTRLDDWTLSLLTNQELLSLMNENCQGMQLVLNDKRAVWKNKNYKTGALYVALFNLNDAEDVISIALSELEETLAEKDYSLSELWDKSQTHTKQGRIEAVIPAHGVKVYHIL